MGDQSLTDKAKAPINGSKVLVAKVGMAMSICALLT
jgi:hypothetical protein